MADTKISALPASTTPLAGTEVLPIVQSGTTKQVSVANLTAGRDVSVNTLTSTVATGTAPFTVTSTTQVANLNSATAGTASNLKSNATTGVMQIVGPTASTTRVMTIPDANFTAARTDTAQTFTGTQTFSGTVIAAKLQTISNSATVAGGATTTVLTLSSSVTGTYYVTADFGGQGNEIYSGMAIIVANAGSFRIVTNGGGTRSAISLSGADVQITNALGVTLTAYAAAIFVGY